MQSEREDNPRKELIERVGKAYFDACRKIAKVVSRLKEKKTSK